MLRAPRSRLTQKQIVFCCMKCIQILVRAQMGFVWRYEIVVVLYVLYHGIRECEVYTDIGARADPSLGKCRYAMRDRPYLILTIWIWCISYASDLCVSVYPGSIFPEMSKGFQQHISVLVAQGLPPQTQLHND